MTTHPRSFFVAAAFLLFFFAGASAQPLDRCPNGAAAQGQRYLAVISDLHIGLGRGPDGKWNPMEDFRWDAALRSFLARVQECGAGRVDLVIAGDLLELWQPPADAACKDRQGCSIAEAERITEAVLRGHRETLAVLKAFANAGSNRIHVIPGNHDAALLVPRIWKKFESALGAASGRLVLVKSGVWLSDDGTVLIEHGHQIGGDVNRYDTWPEVVRSVGGAEYIVRPWGENFVQALFNEQETQYPVIDNLSPESAGARFRMADRGLWGSASDLARFLAFNLFETSPQQKVQFLGGPDDRAPQRWDVQLGRQMGHRLLSDALPAEDPFRAALLAADERGQALRSELDAAVRDASRTSDAEVLLLCDQVAIRQDAPRCEPRVLGAGVEKLIVPRMRVMREHVRARLAQADQARVRTLIYGHTHMLEEAWSLDISDFVTVTVLNSGAFQRVVDELGFVARAKARGITPARALKVLEVSDLAPCYSAVLVPASGGASQARTVHWHAPDGAAAQFVEPRDARCR